MLLLGRYLSPFVRRVTVSMALLRVPFERKPLSAYDHKDELRRFNPLGKIPALLLAGAVKNWYDIFIPLGTDNDGHSGKDYNLASSGNAC